jgi:hypothetical protein
MIFLYNEKIIEFQMFAGSFANDQVWVGLNWECLCWSAIQTFEGGRDC